MPRAIAAIFAIILLLFIAIFASQAALEDAGDDVLVENETWTPSAGSITTLNDSEKTGAYYDSNVTVRDENDTVVDVGDDYEWFAGNGTVKAVAGGELDGDANASITYGYSQTTEEQRTFAGLLSHVPGALGLIIPLFVLIIFIKMLGGG